MHVLIVDDELEIGNALQELIEQWGHQVILAGNGKQATELFKKHNGFDLVLLDLLLPDVKGYELIPMFRKTSPHVPVITMTGHNSRELEAATRKNGVMYYMQKPIDMRALKTIFDHLARKNYSMAS
jgi:DNA-binding response OmpR family regulator